MKLYIFFLTVFLFSQCSTIETTSRKETVREACQVAEVTSTNWLKEMIETSEGQSCTIYAVYSADYKGQEVILIYYSGPLCDQCAGEVVYDCEGEAVYFCNPEQDRLLKNKKLVWERE